MHSGGACTCDGPSGLHHPSPRGCCGHFLGSLSFLSNTIRFPESSNGTPVFVHHLEAGLPPAALHLLKNLITFLLSIGLWGWRGPPVLGLSSLGCQSASSDLALHPQRCMWRLLRAPRTGTAHRQAEGPEDTQTAACCSHLEGPDTSFKVLSREVAGTDSKGQRGPAWSPACTPPCRPSPVSCTSYELWQAGRDVRKVAVGLGSCHLLLGEPDYQGPSLPFPQRPRPHPQGHNCSEGPPYLLLPLPFPAKITH